MTNQKLSIVLHWLLMMTIVVGIIILGVDKVVSSDAVVAVLSGAGGITGTNLAKLNGHM